MKKRYYKPPYVSKKRTEEFLAEHYESPLFIALHETALDFKLLSKLIQKRGLVNYFKQRLTYDRTNF